MTDLDGSMPRLLLVPIIVLACSESIGDRYTIVEPKELISTESGWLARPVDIEIDRDGKIYVLDWLAHRIVEFSQSGELLAVLGEEGEGPGEFRGPRHLTVTDDSIRVVDARNGRLQTLTMSGEYVRSTVLPPGSNLGPMAVDGQGRLIIGTFGMYDVLANYYDPDAILVAGLGKPLAPVASVLSFGEMKQQMIDGQVPTMDLNGVIPFFGTEGGLWLVHNGTGRVDRYDQQGALLDSIDVSLPEMREIRNEATRKNRETLDNPRNYYPLAYFVDAQEIDGRIWLLLNMPDGRDARLIIIDNAGSVLQRLEFSGLDGAGRFEVDVDRSTIYIVDKNDARVISADLPERPARK